VPLLTVRDLTVSISREGARFRAVDAISFDLEAGKTLALVGESGCGKTMTALALLRLVPPVAKVEEGEVGLHGRDLLRLNETEMQDVRGGEIGIIFQEPLTALDPVYTIGEQVAEGLRRHAGLRRREAWRQAVEQLREAGIPDAGRRAHEYPHQLSGGMRQRAMIATAVACRPAVLLADEPTTALDVSVQAHILDLLRRLQAERNMALLLITHDLGVVAEMADEVAVMYAGHIIERAPVAALFGQPAHPYTRGLLATVPRLSHGERPPRLPSVGGVVPDLSCLPDTCRFAARCQDSAPECQQPIALTEVEPGHWVRCVCAREVAA
jgi:oligopeptide/dipeptide ABC transporter ATP-binding protein